jgi:phosphoglycolate phosphatase
MNDDFTLSCVLFDLDGTLVDTAPDLIACLNKALTSHGFSTVDVERVKPFISHGAAYMITHSLGDTVSPGQHAEILMTMLDYYEDNISEHSRFFHGITDLITSIEESGLKWGIVTNKRERFTNPLVSALKLTNRAACIISGDTTANPKPHSEPMFAACKQAGVNPEECVYIGDAPHDITAGKNAGMKTLAAVYGYLKPDDSPETWGADGLIDHPDQLSVWINSQLCR